MGEGRESRLAGRLRWVLAAAVLCGGSLFAFAPASDFRLLSGDGATTEFLFNKHAIHHRFCATCGIESFAEGTRPSDGAAVVAINARCLDGVDPATLKIKQVDGRRF